MNLNCKEEAEVSLHEREFLVDREQRSLCEVFGWRHKRLVQQHLTLEFREGHQRLRKGRKKGALLITANTRKGAGVRKLPSMDALSIWGGAVPSPGCLHTDLEMSHHLSCYQTIFQFFGLQLEPHTLRRELLAPPKQEHPMWGGNPARLQSTQHQVTQRVRRSSASGSSVASFRFSKLIRSRGLWFQANSTASWKVVTSRSYWPTSFLKVIWKSTKSVISLHL